MNRNRSFSGQHVSITTAVERFNRRKYGHDDVINSSKNGSQANTIVRKESKQAVLESTRRRQNSKRTQTRNRKYQESKRNDSLPVTEISKITRELTFFLPNSWETGKREKDWKDLLQKHKPVTNGNVCVSEIEINIEKNNAASHK